MSMTSQGRPCACVIRGVISSPICWGSLVKMAESIQSLCAGPAFKRPRLDYSAENTVRGLPFDSLSSKDEFRDISKRSRPTPELTSADPQIDINGGDSGFHEALPPLINSIDSTIINNPNIDEYNQYLGNDTNGSNIELEGQLYFSTMNGQPPDRDSEDAEDVGSSFSDFSGLSDGSGHDTSNISGPYTYVQRLMEIGKDPRDVLMEMLPSDAMLPPNLSSNLLWKLVLTAFREPPPRVKLPNINTMEHVVSLLRTCKKIIVLTGAGVSVSCGIPDFRSRNGVYARLSQDYPDLPDPSAMFDIAYFKKDPRPFFKFAKEIYPGMFQPSPSHHFIHLIEKHGKLLRNYTQNIDTLEHAAGIKRVITCHGSFATASCTVCHYKVESSEIKEDIFNQRIPYCTKCPSTLEERGIMKPDIVFFGEGLSDEFHECMAMDKEECDLLVVMGSSLKVRPVACIPGNLPAHVPQILINREPLRHLNFDVELLGDCDVIIQELCHRLAKDWNIRNTQGQPLKEISSLPTPAKTPSTSSATFVVSNNNVTCKHVADVEEESNSCDYRGMSAIKLDDSQDGSSSEMPNNCGNGDYNSQTLPQDGHVSPLRDSISSRLPEQSYLFIPPSRYIFQGAEVYQDSQRSLMPNVGCPSPNLLLVHTDSSSFSSEDEEDYEDRQRGTASVQSPDHSSLSTSEDQSPSDSPRNQPQFDEVPKGENKS